MRRTINTVVVVGLAAASVTTLGHGSAATADSQTATYLVLADDGAALDAVVAAVEASGGTVEHLNAAIGLVTASTSDATFAADVSTHVGVAGVARDTPIGYAPDEAAQRRDVVEREGRTESQRSSVHSGSRGADPLSSLQWDMQMIDATPSGSYRDQRGRRERAGRHHRHRDRRQPPRHRTELQQPAEPQLHDRHRTDRRTMCGRTRCVL